MSWEAYSVAVRIRLTDMVTPALGVISRGMRSLNTDTEAAKRNVAELEKRLQSIKGLAITGGALLGAGTFGLSLFKGPLEEAKKFDQQVQRFKLNGLGDAVTGEAAQFAKGMGVIGTSATDAMRLVNEAQGVFRESGLGGSKALEGGKLAAPMLAKIAFATQGLDEEAGSRMRTSSLAMLRFIEMRGGLHSAGRFNSIADAGWKAIQSSGGNVNWELYRQFMARGGIAAQGLSDAALFGRLEPIIGELKGNAGVGLMTAYNRITGITKPPNQVAHMLANSGIWDNSKIEWNSQGGIKQFRGEPLRKDVATLFRSDPDLAYQSFILPIYRKLHADTAGERAHLNAMVFGREGGKLYTLIDRQIEVMKRSEASWKKALGIDDSVKVASDTLQGKVLDLHAKWRDVLNALGTVVLPAAIDGVKGLTSGLRTVIEFTQKFPNLTKDMLVMGGGLAALMVVGGAVTLATAGFRTLGLVLGSGGAVAGGGLLGAITGLLGPIGVAVAGVTALAAIMNLLKPDKKDDGQAHEGEHWERNRSGRGGEWVKNTRVVGAHRSFMGTRENWVPDGAGGGHWETVNTVAPKASGPASPPVVLNMDGRRVGEIVTNHQARAASRPQTNGGGFDSRMQLGASGGW